MVLPDFSLQSCFSPLDPTQRRALSIGEQPPIAAQGYCAKCETTHQLLRTPHTHEIALNLMRQIRELGRIDLDVPPSDRTSSLLTTNRLRRDSGGKMFGVLLCETPTKHLGYIKAFSGQFNRLWYVPGWVPPIPDAQATQAHQAETEMRVEQISNQVDDLGKRFVPLRKELEALAKRYEPLIENRIQENLQRKLTRHKERSRLETGDNLIELHDLNHQSRTDKEALRDIRREYRETLEPIDEQLTRLQDTFAHLKRARRTLSSELSHELLASYYLRNFAGENCALTEVFLGEGVPTGTGDCCAPKLLQFASIHNLRPIGLAEFWLGTPKVEDRYDGEFYPSCREKCAPIMGYMLCRMNKDLD